MGELAHRDEKLSAAAHKAADPATIQATVDDLLATRFDTQAQVGAAFDGFSAADVARIQQAYDARKPSVPFSDRFANDLGDEKEAVEDLLGGVVTNGDVAAAIGTLRDLRPDEQAAVIDDLDERAFQRLLDEIPADQRTDLAELVRNTGDPVRKARLWAVFHKGKAAVEAEQAKTPYADDTEWYWFDDATEIDNQRIEDRIDAITETTNAEVDEELAFFLANGGDLEEVIERKEREEEVEMKYHLDLVTDGGRRNGTGDKLVWEKDEIDLLDEALSLMPRENFMDREELVEARRGHIDTHQQAAAYYSDTNHSFSLFDAGIDPGCAPGSAPSVAPRPAGWTGPHALTQTFIHELGHMVDASHPDVYAAYVAAAGWGHTAGTAENLTGLGLSPTEATDALGGDYRKEVVHDGVRYREDYMDGAGRVLTVDEGHVPAGPSWSYARAHPKDEFAEHYKKALLGDPIVAKSYLDEPKAIADAKEQALHEAQLHAFTLWVQGAAEADIAAARAEVEASQAAFDDAAADRASMQAQFSIMRDDVFHADDAEKGASASLTAAGVSDEKLKEFHEKAARASTPAEVEKIAAGFMPATGGGP